MRVTAEAKEATRRAILNTAQELFRSAGFEATTTRDIAKAVGIATGTLFNYFATKEAIVTCLVIESQARSERDVSAEQFESLEEALFAHIATAIRALKPFRKYLEPVLETTLSPLVSLERRSEGRSADDLAKGDTALRTDHLETVMSLARRYRLETALTPVALQLYWTLYLGVLRFWTNDRSPKQEDTLALLDQSLAMFVGWLNGRDQSVSSPERSLP